MCPVCKTAMPCLNGSLISLASLEFSVGLLPEQLSVLRASQAEAEGSEGEGEGEGSGDP